MWQFKLSASSLASLKLALTPPERAVNFFFIAIIQNLLLAAAELPQYLLLTLTPAYSPAYRVPAVGTADYVLSAIFVGILCIEMLADNQQQRFQAFKAQATKSGRTLTVLEQGRLNRGFVTEGLWAWSRHPVRILFPPCCLRLIPRDAELCVRAIDVVHPLRFHHRSLSPRLALLVDSCERSRYDGRGGTRQEAPGSAVELLDVVADHDVDALLLEHQFDRGDLEREIPVRPYLTPHFYSYRTSLSNRVSYLAAENEADELFAGFTRCTSAPSASSGPRLRCSRASG